MKTTLFFLLFSTFIYAQDYKQDWEEVKKLEEKQQIKSSNEIVKSIYEKAKTDKNDVQLIKSFMFLTNHQLILNDTVNVLYHLDKEISTASLVNQAILHLIKAKYLKDYWYKNSYRINNKPVTTKDFYQFWTKDIFNEAIEKSYQMSLQNETLLKQTNLLAYENIFEFGDYNQFKNSTLLDYILAENIKYEQQNLDFYKINQDKLFEVLTSNHQLFSNYLIKNISNEKLISFYQKLETNYFDKDKIILERVLFVVNKLNTISIAKKIEVLNQWANFYKNTLIEEEFLYKIAEIEHNQHNKITYPDGFSKALNICNQIITKNNTTENANKRALLLKKHILKKDLQIQTEKYIYENQNHRAFIQYKNLDSLEILVKKINSKMFEKYNKINNLDSDLDRDTIPTNEKVVYRKTYHLTKKYILDYNTTELLLPNLEKGFYIIAFNTFANDDYQEIVTLETLLNVTNIGTLNYYENDKIKVKPVHRNSGKTLNNLTLINNNQLHQLKNKVFSFDKDQKSKIDYKVFNSNDTLIFKDNFYGYNRYNFDKDDEPTVRVKILTDRAIYRPGQKIYIKGIALQNIEEKVSVVKNQTFLVEIEDDNGKDLLKKEVTTNKMGSFSFEYIIPKDVFLGDISIEIDEPDDFEKLKGYNIKKDEHPFWDNIDFQNSRISIKVEEYKRPTFEVIFDKQTENFALNQEMNVKVKAKSFSGANITDAKVKYQIDRNIRSSKNWEKYSSDDNIIVDSTATDQNGEFSVKFIPKEKEGFEQKDLPIYTYSIKIDVTDINGETRSASKSFDLAYHEFKMNFTNVKVFEKTNFEINLSTNNIQNQPIEVKNINLKVKYNYAYHKKFKPRKFNIPEIKTIDSIQYIHLFPYEKHFADKNQNKLVYETTINCDKNTKIPLNFENLESGFYEIIAETKDKLGNTITTKSNFEYKNDLLNENHSNEIITLKTLNENFQKDGFIHLKLITNVENLFVNLEAVNHENFIFDKEIQLQKHQIIKIPIAKNNTGKVNLVYSTWFDNHYFQSNQEFYVHDIYKETLQIIPITFRSKLEPGSQEKWSFLVKSKYDAEVLANMYDASLDKIYQRDWDNLAINQYYNNYLRNKSATIALNGNSHSFSYKNLNYINFKTNHIKLLYDEIDLKFPNKIIDFVTKKPIATNAKIVRGTITEGGMPVPGVSVIVKGTNNGTESDFNGYYEIYAEKGEELEFSYVGMKTQKIIVIANELHVSMVEEAQYLQEVVLVGYSTISREGLVGSVETTKTENNSILQVLQGTTSGVSILSGSGQPGNPAVVRIRGFGTINDNANPLYVIDGIPTTFQDIPVDSILNINVLKGSEATALYGSRAANGVIIINTTKKLENFKPVIPRTNFSETAFFFPHLTTDTKGNISFEFKTPDALTQWKLRLLAHNKNGVSAYHEDFAITQKELMVTPNMPRFLREKDEIVLTTKITNLSANAQKGKATLKLFNALDMKPIDVEMQNKNAVQNFEIDANGNTTISWKVFIPNGLQGVQYQVLAQTETHSDGEENILPVLPNSMLVTESKPIWVRENSEKTFTFNNFKDNNSSTLRHHLMTLEYTSNPTWLAIQSLPYLMEYEHECAEQTFARYYANVLATEVINSQPKIKEVFEVWRKQGKPTSKLAQNEELKSIILAETPWLKDMENEAEQRKNLALLFDLEQMKTSTDATLNKLKAKQKSNGAFAWFDGGYDNRYITQHIISGLGHLNKLIKNNTLTNDYQSITDKAIAFLDQEFIKDHEKRKKILAKNKDKKASKIWINAYNELHYLYARSFYLQKNPISAKQKTIFKEYLEQIKTQWKEFSLYEKAMAALVLHRFEDKETPQEIITAFKETSSNNEEWGMYWINNKNSWYWYQSSIETQSLIIEAFMEIKNDTKSADLMKVWLIKNKQTKSWSNTKATTEAVYALLLQGSDFMNVENDTKISWGNAEKLNQKLQENPEEVGSGYIKINYKKEEIQPELATLTIKNDNKVPGFGGIYWQYFEELDQIKSSENGPLKMQKELYLKKVIAQDKPAELEKISSISSLKIGDRVVVRIIVSTTEDMDFVHLKDMRASCFEPVDVISSYQWQNGMGFYKSTKDAATHFFFDTLRKGTFVLEYEVIVNNIGDFSNGISTLQSMYAPEYSHHTGGVRVRVE